MFKRFAIRSLAVLASLIAIVPAFAAELPIKGQSESGITRYSLKIPTTAGVNDFTAKIPACENMSVYWERGNSAQVTLYPADSDDTTATLIDDNTPIRVFTTTERYGPFTPTKAYVSFVVNTVNASVPSKILVNCSNFASSGGGVEVITNDMLAELGDQNVIYQVTDATDGTDCAVGTDGTETAFCGWDGAAYIPVGVAAAGDEMDATQSVPTAGEEYARPRGTITDPATVDFGIGIGYGSATTFTSETYPGSGVNVDEADNLFGPYYNGDPCSAVRLNAQEHAFEDCYEFSYRETAGTASDTWVEENFDVTSPDVTFGLSSIDATPAPVVGEYVVFSGGATCEILAWSSPNLQCRMSYKADVAVAQTASWGAGLGGGTVSTIAAVNNANTSWRPRHMVWDTMDQIAEFGWYSEESTGLPAILIRNGEVRMGTNDNPDSQLLLGAPGGMQSLQTIGAIGLGYGGVRLSPGAADSGAFTIAGRGTGTDEDLVFNFNSANVVTVTSTTGVTTINFPDNSIPAADINGGADLILSGTVVLDTDAIASTACDTSDTAISATGVAATDVLSWSFNSDPTSITGYAPVTTGGLAIYAYPGTNTVSFKVCNPTASSITPGAAVTLNWNVVR